MKRVISNNPSVAIIMATWEVEMFLDINWILTDPIAPVPIAKVSRLKIDDLSSSGAS